MASAVPPPVGLSSLADMVLYPPADSLVSVRGAASSALRCGELAALLGMLLQETVTVERFSQAKHSCRMSMATIKSTNDLTKEELEDYKEAFNNFDKDGNGNIDEGELGVVLRSLGYSPTNQQLKDMMKRVDTDQSGGISFEEFVAMMQLREVETDFEVEISEAFSFFDKDGDGEVTPKELAEIMRGLGDKLTDEEIKLLVRVADKDGDGKISVEEFVQFMYS